MLCFPGLGERNLIQSDRPISVFCKASGGDNQFHVQMPSKDSLGNHFYIPPLKGINLTNATIKITATEDSTVDIIAGDYHNLDTLNMTGQQIFRAFVEDKVSLKT